MSRMRQAVRGAAEFVQAHRRALTVGTVLLLACLGFLALHRMIAEVHWRQLRYALHAIPSWRLAAALGLTCVSYLLLTLYDVIALRIVGKPLPYRTAALASFASYTLSHNLGLGLLTGGSARYRVDSAKGQTTREIVEVIATASVTFWLGVFAVTAGLLAVRVLAATDPALQQRMVDFQASLRDEAHAKGKVVRDQAGGSRKLGF